MGPYLGQKQEFAEQDRNQYGREKDLFEFMTCKTLRIGHELLNLH